MRYFLELGSKCVRTWWFWAFVLLVIPNCGLQTGGLGCDPNDKECLCKQDPKDCPPPPDCPNPENPECEPPPDCPDPNNPDCDPPPVCPDPNNPACNMPPDPNMFQPGTDPTSAIMCEFPKPVDPNIGNCATAAEAAAGLKTTQAATALVTGQNSGAAMDWSAAALAACGGLPKKITYLAGTFPDGSAVCLNCMSQIPNVYADPTKACIAKCVELITVGGYTPPGGAQDYCVTNAHTATNFVKSTCYDGVCTNGGTPDPAWSDPRRNPEAVIWVDKIGTDDNGGTNNLTKTTATAGVFDAGAASAQTILSGDAWVEFSAGQNGQQIAVSLRNSCADPLNCPDVDPTINNIGFSISLNADDLVYVIENDGANLVFTPMNFAYTPQDRFRIHAEDLHNGTAKITYSKLDSPPCMPGTQCPDTVFHTSIVPSAIFPLRVDAAFRVQNSSVTNVTLVRIQQ